MAKNNVIQFPTTRQAKTWLLVGCVLMVASLVALPFGLVHIFALASNVEGWFNFGPLLTLVIIVPFWFFLLICLKAMTFFEDWVERALWATLVLTVFFFGGSYYRSLGSSWLNVILFGLLPLIAGFLIPWSYSQAKKISKGTTLFPHDTEKHDPEIAPPSQPS